MCCYRVGKTAEALLICKIMKMKRVDLKIMLSLTQY